MCKRTLTPSNAALAVKMLRRVVTVPAADLARRIADRSFTLPEYNRVAELAGSASYRTLLATVRRHDSGRVAA